MPMLFRYRVFCTTENGYVEETIFRPEGQLPPTCPNNHAHAINTSLTTIIESVTDAPLTDAKGALVTSTTGPLEDDGRPIFVEYPASINRKTFYTGAGDKWPPDPGSTGQGEGQQILVEFTRTDQSVQSPEEHEVVFGFNDSVEIHDGEVSWKPVDAFSAKDRFSFLLRFPATPVTLAANGDGNVNLVPLGPGMSLIIPAAMNGTHNINYETAVPVPDPNKQGFWYCSYDESTVSPSNTPQSAPYNLLTFPVIASICKNMGMGSPRGIFDVDAYRVEWCHPNWECIFKVTKVTPGQGIASGWLLTFRKNTT